MSLARERLAAFLSPDVISALEELVDELVSERAAQPERVVSPWLSLTAAADYLGISPRQLERYVQQRSVRSSTLGRRRLLHRDDLDAFARAATREDVTPATPPRRRNRTLDLAGART